MSFKLITKPEFTGIVNAEIPGDNERAQKVSFHVEFKRLTTREYDDLLARMRASAKAVEDGLEATETDQSLVDEVLTGFGDDGFDDNGNPLAFTPGNVQALCDVFPLRAAIVSAFFASYAKAKAKN